MRIDILTLFPAMFAGPFSESIIKRATEKGILEIIVHQIRDYAPDKHHITDDYPYGGGAGMVMKPEPLFSAVESILGLPPLSRDNCVLPEAMQEGMTSPSCVSAYTTVPVILMTPQGRQFDQHVAHELAAHDRLLFICGHYEGVDERVREHLVTDEVSIGDYVLTGGELPAMVVIDALARLIPGVLGAEEATHEESHTRGTLEYPQYTRPANFRGWAVPPVLLSGHHGEVERFHQTESLRRTLRRRPELLRRAELTKEEEKILRKLLKG
ncbi:MAG: tRNA (guanosine(37)-N1)-methyltransferase TrmD [Chloroflexota bacterium]|nr:MAG: tRNA (guanosine(37)-N1)-methyltransferase TrmD [Chloroflexota bacterium]